MGEPLFTIEDAPSPSRRGSRVSKPQSSSLDNEAASRVYEPVNTGTVRPSRLSVPLNSDGTIDFSRLRGDAKQQLAEALRHPSTAETLLGKEPEPIFSDSDIASLFAGVSQIEQMLAKLLMRVPADIAAEAFAYTPTDLMLLTPPTQNILSKYSPGWVNEHKDLIAFALIFTGITRRQFDTALQAAKVRQESEQRKQQPQAGPVQ